MKKLLTMFLIVVLTTVFTTGCSAQGLADVNTTYSARGPLGGNAATIVFKIGEPSMTVNGAEQEIDPGRGTVPILENGRTLLPVRAVVEAMGGSIEWNDETMEAKLSKDDTVIILTLGSSVAILNGEEHELDAAPVMANDRIMLPIRFIAESFDFDVKWDSDSMEVTLTGIFDTKNEGQAQNTEVSMNNPGNFNFETKRVMLNSGYEMPINGLGTYSLHGETCINSVKSALKSGVRLIDTASAYGNETEVGQAVREAMEEYGIAREEIFVITKIYPGSEMANPKESIQGCLDRLNIGYVDMMLLHHPDPNDVAAYKVMEEFVKEGKIRSIGLSNYYVEELKEFLPQVDTKPALVQNEIHPYYQENDVIPYIQSLGITVQGWYPLGGRGHTAELLGDPVISEIAEAHGVSSAQVILRWNLQKGVVVIPGSSNPEHIEENNELYHFSLTDEEMQKINALDRGEKHDWY